MLHNSILIVFAGTRGGLIADLSTALSNVPSMLLEFLLPLLMQSSRILQDRRRVTTSVAAESDRRHRRRPCGFDRASESQAYGHHFSWAAGSFLTNPWSCLLGFQETAVAAAAPEMAATVRSVALDQSPLRSLSLQKIDLELVIRHLLHHPGVQIDGLTRVKPSWSGIWTGSVL